MTRRIEMDEVELRRLAADPEQTQGMLATAMGCSIACVISRMTVLGIVRPETSRRRQFTAHTAGLDPETSGLEGRKDKEREIRERQPWPIAGGFEDAKVPREQCLGRISAKSPERSSSSAGWTADAA